MSDDHHMANLSQHAPNVPGPNSSLGPPPVARPRNDDRSRKLSCKECRRLKLKCDRVFPCQSCVKRGCGSLCPEGALTAGRGSRFILANTEQLHDKISELSDRVRQLEEALEQVQAQCSNQRHPLLAPDLLKIKTSQELYGTTPFPPPPANADSSAVPSSSTRQTEGLGESVGALSLYPPTPIKFANQPLQITDPVSSNSTSDRPRYTTPPEVASDILQLSATFPFPWMVDLSMRKRIRDALPPREEAERICNEARSNALWQFNLDTAETFLPNLLHYCYETPVESLSPRRLALLLMVLSIGSLVDLNQPLGSLHGEAYHHLARASVCEIPLMEEPDFDVLHALFCMIYYHLIFSDNKKAVGYAWNLMGFVAKLAQGLGLHRDSTRGGKLIPEEHERRRAIFWELLNMDCRMSLSLGRPPSISLAHVDVARPSYVGAGIYVPREEIVYHNWKNDFFIECLSPILEAMTNAKQLIEYDQLLALDRSARDFYVPPILGELENSTETPRFLVMQRGLVIMGREIALLQLHRRYFTQAMNSPEPFDMHHDYAPSVLATYLSASNLIAAVEQLYEKESQLSVRFLHFWFNVFSAAVMLSLFISRAPTTPLATFAVQDLERICRLFRRATNLPLSAKVLPHITKLAEKGRLSLRQNMSSPSHLAAGNPYPVTLPASFDRAHRILGEHADRMRLTAPAVRSINSGAGGRGATTTNTSSSSSTRTSLSPSISSVGAGATGMLSSKHSSLQDTLPDIYHFSSLGVGVEGRYSFTPATSMQQQQKTNLFVPSSPRIGEDEKFNFDHGALMAELEETSYMAWF
ncbi:transcriptional regulator family: Fungal Specific TF [Agaricus bisporus var. burnettii]|uniref:Transcriptional regulator family: Fungal Specific TF n=1 Tax=Agaricus bisporus var. burnettii TaxID=192524 RepID=A0A8H7C7P8_AGABI|nr:transcriptional regulator family: Fungal Specific TF [Agaricus bisporus var. burnettii]